MHLHLLPLISQVGCRQLFSRVNPASVIPEEATDLEFLDEVVDAIVIEQPVPADARVPKLSALARLEFIEEQIQTLTSLDTAGGFRNPTIQPSLIKVTESGPDGVFAACRALKREYRYEERYRKARQDAGRRMLDNQRPEQSKYSSDMAMMLLRS